jgi:hypothetical protein
VVSLLDQTAGGLFVRKLCATKKKEFWKKSLDLAKIMPGASRRAVVCKNSLPYDNDNPRLMERVCTMSDFILCQAFFWRNISNCFFAYIVDDFTYTILLILSSSEIVPRRKSKLFIALRRRQRSLYE